MSEALSDEEMALVAELKRDVLAEPGVETALREDLYNESLHFLKECIIVARRIQALDDVLTARRIMTDVTVWAKELHERMDDEIGRHKVTRGLDL